MGNKVRTKMPISDRAKQFAPFSALRGLTEALEKKEKIYIARAELPEDAQQQINQQLTLVHTDMEISVCFYCNGEYIRKSGNVTKIDMTERYMKIEETLIPFADILEITL